jgi:hypothetical protein
MFLGFLYDPFVACKLKQEYQHRTRSANAAVAAHRVRRSAPNRRRAFDRLVINGIDCSAAQLI